MRVTAIIAAGGSGLRLGAAVPKQMLDIGGQSMLAHSVRAFDRHPGVTDVIVALPAEYMAHAHAILGATLRPVRCVAGGDRRQDSVARAFDVVPATADVVLVHDAARPFVTEAVISRAIAAAAAHGAAIVGISATDTVKRIDSNRPTPRILETLPRDLIVLAQTPQAFRRDVLQDAVAVGRAGVEATDEAALAQRAGHVVRVVEGDRANVKITVGADLAAARAHAAPGAPQPSSAATEARVTGDAQQAVRVGLGYDLHRLVVGRPLILGGVIIPADAGALGHSDADAACHAATDAILGAATLGDIGRHFPDSDPQWKGASSIELLGRAAAMVRGAGYDVLNLDVVVILERPRIAAFVERIREGLADAIGIDVGAVSVKGKSNEGVDAVGRGEAIAAHAVALVRRLGSSVDAAADEGAGPGAQVRGE